MANPLNEIRKGMRVCDSSGEEIGTVDWVHLSDEDPETPQAETATPGRVKNRGRTSLPRLLADFFTTDDVPEVLRSRLLREGFLRIDSDGLFAADRYVFPRQIRSVDGDRVTLKIGRDELAKR